MKSNHANAQPSIGLFQAVLDALPFCVFWKDRDSVGLGCNQALADVAGLTSPANYIGKTDYELPWTAEEADFYRDCDRRVMESGKAELNIIESQRQADGRLAWLETSKIPLTDGNGNIIGILGAFHDISERKRVEDENIANQKLESLSTLAAGLAHDFNNVLMMITGSCQLAKMKMSSGANDADILKYLNNIESATSQASMLTEKFMNYSKRGAVTKTVCNFPQMLEEITSFMQSSISSTIKYNVDENSGNLYGEINQIHQVMNNLLLNAAQASSHNEEIIVTLKHCEINGSDTLPLRPGSYFEISIKDQGIGMSEAQKQQIFKPYFTTKEYGHGLGLSSCVTIIKNHNGAIQVDSQLGLGSTFKVYLPICQQNNNIKLQHLPFSEDIVQGSGRILYIEDDINTQASTLELLQELGYQVQCHCCLQTAIIDIKQHPDSFDLVITDFILNSDLQGGLEILDAVKLLRPDCPVILITGYFKNLEHRAETKPQFSFIAQKPLGVAKISQLVARFIISEDIVQQQGSLSPTNQGNSILENSSAGEELAIKPSQSNNKNILIVDDEPLIIKFLERTLTCHNYNVITANGGLDALDKLKQQNVDLIITDQNMPDMKGTELIHVVKRLLPNTPIIICSGYSEKINEHNIAQFGINYLHKKTTNIEGLIKAVTNLLAPQ